MTYSNPHYVLLSALSFAAPGLASCMADVADPETAPAASELAGPVIDPPVCDVILLKRWRTPVPLGIDAGSAGQAPRAAMSTNGGAIVAWLEHISGTLDYKIKANRYTPGLFAAWQAAPDVISSFTLNASASYPPVSPEVAMDGSGNAFVVWAEYVGTTSYDVKVQRYTAAAGWSATTTLGSGSLLAPPRFSVAADDAGNAIAVWEQQAVPTSIRYARFTGGAWGASALLENSAGPAGHPVIDAGRNGVMMAAWTQFDIETSLYTRRWSGAAWGAITRVDSAFDGVPAALPTVDVSDDGDAVVTWVANNMGTRELWSNEASAVGTWAGARQVAISADDILGEAAIDDNRDGVVAWGGPASWNAQGRRILPGGALDATTQILDTLAANVGAVSVTADDAFGAIAVWTQHDGTAANVYARHLRHRIASPGCPEQWSWGAGPITLETSASPAFGASVVASGSGSAVAAWKQTDAAGETAYASVYW